MFERKMPFWEVAALVAEHLDAKTHRRIRDACRRDFAEQTGGSVPEAQLHRTWYGRVVVDGWVARYLRRGDNRGGIYLIARPEEEERQLDAIQLPVRDEGDMLHLKLNIGRLENRFVMGGATLRNSMIARAAQAPYADFVNDMQRIVDAEEFLGLGFGAYTIDCEYGSWAATFWDAWLPVDLRIDTGYVDTESAARGLAIVTIAYVRQHPVVRRPDAANGRNPPWSHWP